MIVSPFHYTKCAHKHIDKDEEYFSLERMKEEAKKNICMLQRKEVKDKVWNIGKCYVRDFKLFSECELTKKQLWGVRLKPKFQLPRIRKEFYNEVRKGKEVRLEVEERGRRGSEMKGRRVCKSMNCYFDPKIKKRKDEEWRRRSVGIGYNRKEELVIGKCLHV